MTLADPGVVPTAGVGMDLIPPLISSDLESSEGRFLWFLKGCPGPSGGPGGPQSWLLDAANRVPHNSNPKAKKGATLGSARL